MKKLYCWRCKMEVPMLEGEEFDEACRLYGYMFQPENPGKTMEERALPLADFYERITGTREVNPNAIRHHGVALYGPPCEACGKPYRTPKAKLCAACGNSRR